MNPPDPPPVGIDQVVATQMMVVGGLLHRRRSCEKKYLRKARTGTMPKLPIRELRSVLPDALT
jgi:hypothetical protein